MLINPLLSFLNTFFSKRGLSAPDGRALYAYRCSDCEFTQLGTFLREHAPRKITKFIFMNYIDALFILYSSEFIRRYHVEGNPKWDMILKSVNWGHIPVPLLYKKTTSGIRFWRRKLRGLGHAVGYLHTLACEGGLPIRMIENESGYLISYFRAIYSELQTQQGNRTAFDIAKTLGSDIPATMQNELVFEVAGEFCQTLYELLKAQNCHGAAALKMLQQNNPDWHKSLPLVLPEDSAADIVRKLLAVDDASMTGANAFRVDRYWIKNDDCWYCDAKFRIPKTLRTDQISDIFECQISPNQSRLILSAHWKNGTARLALLTKTEDYIWRIETLPAAEKPLTGSAAQQDIMVTLYEGPCLLGQGIPKGGVALTDDLPWVFESINASDSALRLVGSGSVNSTKSALFVALPVNSSLDISGDGEFDIPVQINDSNRYLTKISGIFNIVLQDGAICKICTGQDIDVTTEYYIKPTEVLNIKSDYPIHRGYPKIAWKSNSGVGMVTENELIWRPIKVGNSSWYNMRDVLPKGQVEVRRVANGQVLFSGRVVVLPADFDVQLVPLNAQRGSIILGGVQHARVERYQNNINEIVKPDLLSSSVEVQCNTDLSSNGNVDLRVYWSDGCYLKLLLPFPVGGGRFVNADGDIYFHGMASVNALHGVVADQFSIGNGGNAFINLILKSSNPLSSKHNMLYVDVPLVSGHLASFKQVSLYERMGLMRSILACAGTSQDHIKVEIYSDNLGHDSSTLTVQRYDGKFINRFGKLHIDLANSITFPAMRKDEITVKAVSLKNIHAAPVTLERDVLGYHIVSLSDEGAPWLVFGCLDNSIRIQPVWLGKLKPDEENISLLSTLCNTGTDVCSITIAHTLVRVQENPLGADFYELMQFMKSYKANYDLPLLEVGLFRELANYPDILVQLLIASAMTSDFDAVYAYQDELPFSWGWIPESVWLRAFDQVLTSLTGQMGELLLANQFMIPFLDQLIKTSQLDKRLAIVARSMLSKFPASQLSLNDIPVVDEYMLRMAQQELVRLPDNFGRIGTFSKDIWLKVIPSSRHPVLNKFWLENRFHKRFEKLFNLMLVAALLCRSESKQLGELSVLFEIHYQQAPQQLGVIYQYYAEMARKLNP